MNRSWRARENRTAAQKLLPPPAGSTMSERRPSRKGQWRPILDGELRARALASVRAIAAALEEQPAEATARHPMQLAEQALLNAYLGFPHLGHRHFHLSTPFLH